jgi:putative DNA primase/helicase
MENEVFVQTEKTLNSADILNFTSFEEKINLSEKVESNTTNSSNDSSIPNQEKANFHEEITKRINALNIMSEQDTVEEVISIIEKNCKGNGVEPYIQAIKDKVNWSIRELRIICKQERKKRQVALKDTMPKGKIYPTDEALEFFLFSDFLVSDHPKATYENFELLLKHYDVKIRYNVISKNNEINVQGRTYTDDNEANANYAELLNLAKLNCMETGCITSYVYKAADLNQYNPIKDFILSKPWDGISRLEALYNTIHTPPEFPKHKKEQLIRKWLLSGVAAVLHKGFYAKGILIFQGDQSVGKTAWLKKLVPEPVSEYFGEGCILDPANKDSVKIVISNWVVELGELDATLRKDIARFKAFITNQYDKFRKVYAHEDSRFPRRTIFCGSVNDKEFLVDHTGNVRFWTIPVTFIDYNHDIDMQQVWAEIAVYYKNGERWWLNQEEERELEELNKNHLKTSVLEEMLLEKYVFDQHQFKSQVFVKKNATELLTELGYTQLKTSQTREMAQVLEKLNAKRTPYDKKYWVSYKIHRSYED